MAANFIRYCETLYNCYLDNVYYPITDKGAFFIFDLDKDNCRYFSPSIKFLIGYNNNEFLNKGFIFFKYLIHPKDYSDFISDLLTYIFLTRRQKEYDGKYNKIKKLAFRMRHKDNYWIKIELNILYMTKSYTSMSNMLIGSLQKREDRQDHRSIHNMKNYISGREREVLQLIGNGDSSKIIADKLHISETTAISHRKNLILKLHVKNTAELIKKAVTQHIID